jgi:hypothetical protein
MEYAHTGLPAVNWQQPAGMKSLPAFVIRDKVSKYGEIIPSPSTDLYPSWYQAKTSTSSSQTIDKVSKKLATSCTPAAAKDVQTNGNANSFSVDKFMGGSASGSAATTAPDDVHNCNDALPSITLTAPSDCSDTDTGGTGCLITATVTEGTHPLSSDQFPGTVTVSANGQQIQSFNVSSSPATVSFYYKPTATGTVNMSAQVTDSVLYQSSDSATINATVASTGGGDGHP